MAATHLALAAASLAQGAEPPSLHAMAEACPTRAQVEAIQQDIELSFEGDPTAGAAACRGSGGFVLTPLEAWAYRHLLMARELRFDRPLPWTDQPLYDWIVGTAEGIRYRSDIDRSFCCDPPRVINLRISPDADVASYAVPAPGEITRHGWVPGTHLGLIVHETRHIEVGSHTCGSDGDATWAELGGYGTSAALYWWVAEFTDPALLEPPEVRHGYYRSWYRFGARHTLEQRVCEPVDLEETVVAQGWSPSARRAPAPGPSRRLPAATLLATCPPLDEIRAIDSQVELRVDTMRLGGQSCSLEQGSANLGRLEERSYQALRLLRQLELPEPLPWTSADPWSWFTEQAPILRVALEEHADTVAEPAGTVRVEVPARWYAGLRAEDQGAVVDLLLAMVRAARAAELTRGGDGGPDPERSAAILARELKRHGLEPSTEQPAVPPTYGDLRYHLPSDPLPGEGATGTSELRLEWVDGVPTLTNVPPMGPVDDDED